MQFFFLIKWEEKKTGYIISVCFINPVSYKTYINKMYYKSMIGAEAVILKKKKKVESRRIASVVKICFSIKIDI